MSSFSTSAQTPLTHAWDQAVTEFTRWIGPVDRRPADKARERFLTYCRMRSNQPGLDEAAPFIAFGFLTKAAFEDAQRKSRIYR